MENKETFLMVDQLWKRVPGFVNAYASENGLIGLLNSKGISVHPSSVELKTTKGVYKYAKVINDDFIPVIKAVHQLVCLAFNGPPPNDGLKYEPNHKDGNKLNNNKDNLEWVTRKQNVQHAVDSGLCEGGVRITVIDILTKHEKIFHSLSSAARYFGLTRHNFRTILANHRSVPYKGTYIFMVDNTSDSKLNRYQRKAVVVKDYRTNTITVYRDSEMAGVMTGTKSTAIRFRLYSKHFKGNSETLLNGCLFQKMSDHVIWPEFTPDEVQESVKAYSQGKKNPRKKSLFLQ